MPNSMRRSPFREELVLVTGAAMDEPRRPACGHAGVGPTALVFRTGCTYRQRLEQIFSEFGWPSSARFELGTLDGMIGCVAADMGVTCLPRAVVGRNDSVSIHTLTPDAVQGRDALHHPPHGPSYSALQGFASVPEQQRRGYRRLTYQRRNATPAQIASTKPNGQAPCKKP
jgi:DNA-binding transcriptional LysR family regulator